MSLITDCHSPLLIKFTGKIAKEKVSLVAKEESNKMLCYTNKQKVSISKLYAE